MPKIRVNPRDLGGSSSKRYARISTFRWDEPSDSGFYPGWNPGSWVHSYNYLNYNKSNDTLLTKLTYLFSKQILEFIPENAYLTKITLYFNLKQGEIGTAKAGTLYLGGQSHVVPFKNLRGWNSVTVEGANIPNLDGYSSITFDPGEAKYNDDRFFKGKVYPPSGYDTNEYGYDYEMPIEYIYEFYNLSSSYPPYVELEYEFNPPIPSDNLSPDDTTLNPRTPIRFSWNSIIDQRKFELQYSVNSAPYESIVQTTTNRFYDMPANTITASSGTVSWRVRVMEESGIYSEWTNASFIIGTVSQEKPRIIRPSGDYLKTGRPITFEWDFISNTSEEQKGYEIEVSTANGTQILTGGSENYKTVDLGITDSLVVYWRMRVQNQFDEWSEWTEKVSFQTIGIPPAPQIISIENNNRPLINWNSREQETFKIIVENVNGEKLFETEDVLGASIREYKLKEVLENGKYVFKLKIINVYGIESETTAFTHIINPEEIDKPTISIFKSDFYVEISSNSQDGEVLRDGKVIGELKSGKFRDYTGANYKTYSYQVRIFDNDVVAVSSELGGISQFGEHNTLAPTSDLSKIFVISYGLDDPINKLLDYTVEGVEVLLEGIKYPFIEFSKHSNGGFSLSFFLDNLEEVRELKKLVDLRQEFLLRDSRGENIQGVLLGFSAEYHTLGYKISCMMTITGEEYD